MTEPQDPNHWDLLSSKLGVPHRPPEVEKRPAVEADQRDADEEERKADSAAAHPSSIAGPPRADSAPRPRRPPTDWSRLAEELGIECREDALGAATPEVRSAFPADVVDVSEEPSEVSSEPGTPPPESEGTTFESPGSDMEATPGMVASAEPDVQSTERPAAAAEAVGESTRTDLVPLGTEAELPGIPAAPGAPPDDRGEKTSGRKRRKRRHRPQKPIDEEPAEAAVDETDRESGQRAPEPLRDEPPPGRQPGDTVVAGSSAKEQESQERSKRRRRHRGSGRKKAAPISDDESPGPESQRKPLALQDDSQSSREVGDKSAEPKPADAGRKSDGREQASSGKPSKAAKPGHRGIPSWEEAIQIVISANMEARAKRPAGTSARSRAGRNRAGRDKPSEGTG